jgi:transposase-like protein
MQLHHIDGNNKNNSLDNLQMLCPNCHSQTENYCGGANKKKHYYCKLCNKEIGRKSTYCPQCNTFLQRKIKDRPTKEKLIELFKQYKSFSKIGKLFNISDNGIKKWFKFENLPYKIKDMNEFLLNNV